MMSNINKVFEIEAVDDESVLTCRVYSENQRFPIRLCVDGTMKKQFDEIIRNDNCSIYRLSLNYSWDSSHHCHVGRIIKIRENHHYPNYIYLTDEFIGLLDKLRQAQNSSQVKCLGIEPSRAEPLGADSCESRQEALSASTAPAVKLFPKNIPAPVKILFISILIGSAFFALASSHTEALQGAEGKEALRTNEAQPSEEKQQESVEVVPEEILSVAYLDTKKRTVASVPEGYVALTFDDGPGEYTKDIVDTLLEYKARGTFCFVGKNLESYMDAAIYASEKGMSVQNHSWSHPSMLSLSKRRQTEEIVKTNELLSAVLKKKISYFRPPYGETNNAIQNIAKEQGMRILLWNRDPEDWKVSRQEDILVYFEKTNCSGGIYLLHENQLILDALPEIIQYLKKENLTFMVFD